MRTESRYGIFGGTFDPIHNGHLKTVAEVVARASLDQVIFVPAGNPPHRNSTRASAHHRLEMTRLAVAEHTGFSVDDCEVHRDSLSYTFDSLQLLQQGDRDKCFCLIVGLDAFLGFEGWYQWQALLESTSFIVMRRPGWEVPATLPDWWHRGHAGDLNEFAQRPAGKILVMDIEPVPVSATEIRYGIANGIDVGELVPIPVWNYIRENNLYLETNEK